MNFNCGFTNNGASVDSGGFTHYYLTSHPNLRVKWVKEVFGNIHFFVRFDFIRYTLN